MQDPYDLRCSDCLRGLPDGGWIVDGRWFCSRCHTRIEEEIVKAGSDTLTGRDPEQDEP